MSSIARWSYKNTAQVRTRTGTNQRTGETTYSEPYTIACGFTGESTQQRDNDGMEFVSRNIIWTEDARPKFRDFILINGETEWEEIRSRTIWEMNMFEDVPDYRLIT